MVVFATSIFLILTVLLLIMLTVVKENHEKIFCGIAIFICGAFTVGIADAPTHKGPKAIDVYRGNTTLQITYQDSIPIDSVVVFKEK